MRQMQISNAVGLLLNLAFEPGWEGAFTRDEVPGAWKNGTAIVKTNTQDGDSTPDGTLGTVLGSIINDKKEMGYFVAWTTHPKRAVFVPAHRIKPAIDCVN